MKIALLTKYGELAASTRQRFQQYQPYLEAAGFELDHRPLLDDNYLQQLYVDGRRSLGHVVARYIERLLWLLKVRDVDLLWLHCELFPYLPGAVERLARRQGRPIVFDYDDAIFHNYDLYRNPIVRSVLGPKLRTTISGAELAFCGNAYLADYARPLSQRVEIVPTVVDIDSYYPRPTDRAQESPRIGWIGTPSTWKSHMAPKLRVLAKAAEAGGGRLMAIGAGPMADPHPLLDLLPWSVETEVGCIQSMDIGVMPLPDTPWTRGKCGYKLIQYMACGLPVVASPVGVNCEIVEHGVNGFLAKSDAEWRAAIETLLEDADLRRRMGAAGRRKAEEHYSLQVWGPRVAQMLGELLQCERTAR